MAAVTYLNIFLGTRLLKGSHLKRSSNGCRYIQATSPQRGNANLLGLFPRLLKLGANLGGS